MIAATRAGAVGRMDSRTRVRVSWQTMLDVNFLVGPRLSLIWNPVDVVTVARSGVFNVSSTPVGLLEEFAEAVE